MDMHINTGKTAKILVTLEIQLFPLQQQKTLSLTSDQVGNSNCICILSARALINL